MSAGCDAGLVEPGDEFVDVKVDVVSEAVVGDVLLAGVGERHVGGTPRSLAACSASTSGLLALTWRAWRSRWRATDQSEALDAPVGMVLGTWDHGAGIVSLSWADDRAGEHLTAVWC